MSFSQVPHWFELDLGFFLLPLPSAWIISLCAHLLPWRWCVPVEHLHLLMDWDTQPHAGRTACVLHKLHPGNKRDRKAFTPWDALFAHAMTAASLNLGFAFRSYGEAEADRSSSAPGSQQSIGCYLQGCSAVLCKHPYGKHTLSVGFGIHSLERH